MNADDANKPNPSTYTPQSDSAPYIRTYAKDVAKLTNTVAPAAQPAKPNSAQATDVALPDFDPSPINHADDPSSPKEFKQEVVELTEKDDDGIFAGKAAPQATPLMPQVGVSVAPTVAPVGGAAPETNDEEREAILARLRAKLKNQPPAAPALAPEPAPIRTAAPTFDTTVVPPPPLPPVSRVEPVAAPLPAEGASPIHTFSSDFADRIDQQGASRFSVLAAQNDAVPSPQLPSRKRNFLPLIAGIAMVIIGVGAIGGAYVFTRSGTAVPFVANVPSLITFDESVEVTGTGEDLMRAIAAVADDAGVSGNVIVTYVTGQGTASSSASVPQPGGALIQALSLPAPDILLRNTDETSTVGVVNAGGTNNTFFILKVNSYERTFAGMLAWEARIGNDLSILFPTYPDMPTTASTTASTTTESVSLATPAFSDAVVSNYDVRILRDSSGRSVLLYGYKGKGTLIIARDEAAFTALVGRLSAKGL